MKKCYVVTLLLILVPIIVIQAQNRLSPEEEATQTALDYQRDLRLNDSQKEAFYKVILKSMETKKSMREGQISEEDKSATKESLKVQSQELWALLDDNQKKLYKLLQEVGKLQKELELSDMQKREMFNALAITHDSLKLYMNQGERMDKKEGMDTNMSQEERMKMKEDMQNMSQEERMKMKEDMQNMSQEERLKMKQNRKLNMSQEEKLKMKDGPGDNSLRNNGGNERIRSFRLTERNKLRDILNKTQFDKYMAITEAKSLSKGLTLSKEQQESLLNVLIGDLEAKDKLMADFDRSAPDAKQKMEEEKKKLEDKKMQKIEALLNDQQKELFKNMPKYNRNQELKETDDKN